MIFASWFSSPEDTGGMSGLVLNPVFEPWGYITFDLLFNSPPKAVRLAGTSLVLLNAARRRFFSLGSRVYQS